MAGLKWIRLETTLFENPKLLYLQEDKQYRTVVVYLQSMCYSGRHGLAGFIPKAALRVIAGTLNDAKRLVEEGLWHPAPGGWSIHGWDEYQLSNDEALKRSEKAKKAAAARWAQRNGRAFDDMGDLNAPSIATSIPGRHCSGLCKLSNARTYVRTHKELLTLIGNLTLVNARRGASKDEP